MSSRSRWIDRPPFTAVGLLWPGRRPTRSPGPATGSGGVELRVVSANAMRTNRRPERWADAVVALGADVLCVQELTPEVDSALAATGSLPPNSCTAVRPGSEGTGVWSRFPIHAGEVVDAGYALVSARLAVGVTVLALHAVAPSTREKGPEWRRSFEVLRSVVERTAGPIVVAGDLNATFAHGPLLDLLAGTRLRDAHVDASRPRAHTWHARFPCALLDHVLVSEEVAVHAIGEHRVPGSDHRVVVADLAIV